MPTIDPVAFEALDLLLSAVGDHPDANPGAVERLRALDRSRGTGPYRDVDVFVGEVVGDITTAFENVEPPPAGSGFFGFPGPRHRAALRVRDAFWAAVSSHPPERRTADAQREVRAARRELAAPN